MTEKPDLERDFADSDRLRGRLIREAVYLDDRMDSVIGETILTQSFDEPLALLGLMGIVVPELSASAKIRVISRIIALAGLKEKHGEVVQELQRLNGIRNVTAHARGPLPRDDVPESVHRFKRKRGAPLEPDERDINLRKAIDDFAAIRHRLNDLIPDIQDASHRLRERFAID